MSHNQSKSDKNEGVKYRKTSRWNSHGQQQQRGASGHGGSGKGDNSSNNGQSVLAAGSSLASNRSFKKSINNTQATQTMGRGSGLNSVSSNASGALPTVQNGSHPQPPIHGTSNTLTAGVAVEDNLSSTRPDPKTPPDVSSSQSNKMVPTSNAKVTLGDGGFSFQFGSISPGLVNGIQIPARTTSAPPNIDEQKNDEVCNKVSMTAPPSPIPPIPKQQVPKKVATAFDQSSSKQSQPIPKAKTETPKPSIHPTIGVSMEMPIHQPQPSLQKHQPQTSVQLDGPKPNLPIHQAQSSFDGPKPNLPIQQMHTSFDGPKPNSQIPPTGINMSAPNQLPSASHGPQQLFVGPKSNSQIHQTNSTGQFVGPKPNSQFQPTGINMSTPVPLPGAPHLMQPMFFQGHQHYPFLHQGIVTQSQNMEFTPQLGLGSYSNNPQYLVPSASCKVKITDPKTNEELRYDKRADSFVGSHSKLPDPHRIPPFPPGPQINYHNNLNHSGIYSSTCSLSSVSTPVAPSSQPQRFNYPASQSYMSPYSNSRPNMKPVNPVVGISGSSVPSHPVQVTVKQPPVSSAGKVASSSLPISSPAVKKDDICKLPRVNAEDGHGAVAPELLPLKSEAVQTSISISVDTPSFNTTSVSISLPEKCIANNAKNIRYSQETAKESHIPTEPQIGSLPTPASILLSPPLDDSASNRKGIPKSLEGKTELLSIQSSETLLENGKSPVNEPAIVIDKTNPEFKSSKVSGDENKYVLPVETVLHVKQADFACLHDRSVSVTAATDEDNDDQLLPEPKYENGDIHSSDSISSKSLSISKQLKKDSALDISSICSKVNSLEAVQVKLENSVACLKDHSLDSNVVVSTSSTEGLIDFEVHSYNIVDSASESSLRRSNRTSDQPIIAVKSIETDEDSPTIFAASSSAATLQHKVENGHAPILLVFGSDDNSASELRSSQSAVDMALEDKRKTSPTEKAVNITSDIFMPHKGPEEHRGILSTLESVKVPSSSKLASADPDDFEDTIDMSIPEVNASIKSGHISGVINPDEDGHGVMSREYSRDFLLKFEHQCTALPDNFDFKSDFKALMVAASDIESIPSSGRNFERQFAASLRGAYPSARQDIDYLGNASIRSVQGDHGNLKNQRSQIPMPYLGGGYIPIQPSAGLHVDRWQKRSTGVQKGLNMTPQAPLLVMHKAEKKYEVGKVTDEEEAKQRQLKAILNKLTPQNFEKLFEQVKTLNIDNAVTLTGIISQIFDKALTEPTFCEMYADFCCHLSSELTSITTDDNRLRNPFRAQLLSKCEEEFQRGEKEQEEANEVEEGEIDQTKSQREEKRMKARRRMLGNIRLIGELYKKRMLSDRIMHECILKLLGKQNQDPDEEDIEALCKLMSTIGGLFDNNKCKPHMDSYFSSMGAMSNNKKLSSRVRFMLKDSIDLRKNRWQQRRKIDGPKKIEEVHRDAAQERHAQASRLSHGPSFNPSAGRPMDFGSRGSNNIPSNSRLGSHRGLSNANSRHSSLDFKPLPVLVSQKPNDNGSIALVPQGGLARGMSIRGQPSNLNTPTDPSPLSSGDPRRIPSGHNVCSNVLVQGVKEDDVGQKCLPLLPEGNPQKKEIPVEWSEVHLQKKSIATIREYYSARDENEVGLCIKELKSPIFYPTMISIWVTDSFEQKDMERDLLAKLLVNLTNPQDGMLNHPHLIQGFEMVLNSLEDVMNDAPKAAEFLGHIFAKIILENVVSLNEVGRLVRGGGADLREAGVAGEVMGTVLESIQRERGVEELNGIRGASDIRLEDFLPSDPNCSKKLRLFI